MKIKAVLFDLDGTLIDSLEDLADASNHTLSVFGYPGHPAEAYKYFAGDGLTKLIERILPAEKASHEEIERLRPVWSGYYEKHFADKTRPYGGIKKLIAALKEKKIFTGVVTNKSEDAALLIVEKMFGGGAFDIVYGSKPGIPVKPDPFLAKKALSHFNITGSECIFLGDTAVDIKTALNSGCIPVGALWGFRTEDELTGSGAARIIKEPLDLLYHAS